MRKRRKMSYKQSKRSFRRSGSRTHVKNTWSNPMRGGIRL